MDSLAHLRNATEKVLQDWVTFLGNDEYAQLELVLDRERDRYLFDRDRLAE
jgi:hypothetical protein